MKKVNPHYFSILEGSTFQKSLQVPQNADFLTILTFVGLRGKFAVEALRVGFGKNGSKQTPSKIEK